MKRAESIAVLMAEVFVMFTEDRLVAVDQQAQDELEAAQERELERRRRIREGEKEARSEALELLRWGSRR